METVQLKSKQILDYNYNWDFFCSWFKFQNQNLFILPSMSHKECDVEKVFYVFIDALSLRSSTFPQFINHFLSSLVFCFTHFIISFLLDITKDTGSVGGV